MAYYPNWAAAAFPPENIDFKRFDWVDFAFAVPTQNFGLGWDGDDDSADLLRRLVTTAHQNGKRVKLSVGGWTGSKYFSPAVSTPGNRQIFANAILSVYNQYGLDGIDIDWEFPAQDGNKGNIENPNDSANFLAFLQLLRRTLPPAAKISAATMTVPWSDPQGNPLRDVSGFASVLDWILVMNYDTWGSSSIPGPNAPLSNACHNSTQSSASAVAAVMSWTAAGFPASKIVIGVPSYGYISRSGATNLMTRSLSRSKRAVPKHLPMHLDGASQAATADVSVSALGDDSLDDPSAQTEGTKPASPSAFMVHNEDGGTEDGQVQFRELINQKVLQYLSAWSTSKRGANETDDEGSNDVGVTSVAFAGQQIINVYNGQNGFVRQWDACSSTPYLRSSAARQVITYDDPQSLEMKAVFVRAAGLLGVNMFDVHGDTDKWDLTDGIRRGLGL
ncbi:glycoside hydrolase superfamily [Irpex lacteus]|nr:glycoside hydrolase superfamily [Irpex lacteus]